MAEYRTIFISDVHLGTAGCKDEYLLDFLKNNSSDNLYLVGDILDFWKLKSSWCWTKGHNEILRRILKISKKTNVVYVPGNHDEIIREFIPINFGDIQIVRDASYTSLNGKKYLVFHGDDFDFIVRKYKWIAIVGSFLYEFLLKLNTINAWVRKKFNLPYWSLSKYLKHKAKQAVNFIHSFEKAAVKHAREKGYEGLICGHIHRAMATKIEGIDYYNCGDWVESCTAIVETKEGEFKIIEWIKN